METVAVRAFASFACGLIFLLQVVLEPPDDIIMILQSFTGHLPVCVFPRRGRITDRERVVPGPEADVLAKDSRGRGLCQRVCWRPHSSG